MVIKFDDDVRIEYKKYENTVIPVVVINRKRRLFLINPITKVADFYADVPNLFVESKALVKGIDWEKLTDNEMVRIVSIKKQDGYGTLTMGLLYFTEQGLETYLKAYSMMKNITKNASVPFVKWCEENLLKKTIEVKEEKLQERPNPAFVDNCVNVLKSVKEELQKTSEAVERFNKNLPQFKGMLTMVGKDTKFVDDYTKDTERLKTASTSIDNAIKILHQRGEDNPKGETYYAYLQTMQKRLESMVCDIKNIL